MSVFDDITAFADTVAAGSLVFARVSALFLSAPIVGGTYVPWQAKGLLALAVTLVMAPTLDDQLASGVASGGLYVLAMAREIGLGLALGFFVDLFFHAVRFGGDLIGRNAGYAAAETFDPGSEVMSGPIGDLFHIAVVMLFLISGGHHLLFLALGDSFQMVPVGAFSVGPGLAEVAADASQQVFSIGLALSFPILVAIMAVTVAEGIVARAVPQINILHITFATKIATTMVLLYVGIPAAVAFLGTILLGAEQLMRQILPMMG